MSIDQEKEELKQRLKDKECRDAFVSAYVDETIPFQIRALREQESRKWTQEDLATRTGMKQERISTLENPNYGSYSLRILKQLAVAFDVALLVRFVPFSDLAEWKLHLSSGSLEVQSFDQEDYFKEKPSDESDTSLLRACYSPEVAYQPSMRSNVITFIYRQEPQKGIDKEVQQRVPLEGNNAITFG